MLKKLEIHKYKKIKNIVLNNLFEINYLVGENSSGKTSILEAIFLGCYVDKKIPQFNKSEVKITKGLSKYRCYYITNNNYVLGKYKLSSSGSSSLEELGHSENQDLENTITEYFNINLVSSTFTGYSSPVHLPKDIVEGLKDVASVFGLRIKKLFKDHAIPELGEKESQIRVTDENDETFSINFFAGGYIYLLKLSLALLVKLKLNYGSAQKNIVFCLEEPEAQLNPKIQKLIPELLNYYIKLFKKNNSHPDSSMQFFVSTHSPFVISKISTTKNQKVYLLNEGKLIDSLGLPVKSSNGFFDKDSLIVASRMLGFENEDVGYPENFCLLEESSLQKILEVCKSKNIIKTDWGFVSTGGWTRTSKFLDDLLRLKTLFSCNAFYYDKYCVVTDQISNAEKNTKQYLSLSKLGTRYVELSQTCIEEYYKNLSEEIYTSYKEEKKSDGTTKHIFAVRISELIKDENDFKKLFNNELNFLLK